MPDVIITTIITKLVINFWNFWKSFQMLPLPGAITSQLDKASIVRLTIAYLRYSINNDGSKENIWVIQQLWKYNLWENNDSNNKKSFPGSENLQHTATLLGIGMDALTGKRLSKVTFHFIITLSRLPSLQSIFLKMIMIMLIVNC